MKDNKKELIKLIEELRYKYSTWQVFSDFVEMSAISLSNSVDWLHKEKREERYLEIINSYDKKSQEAFPEMFACLVNALQDSLDTTGLTDILGQVFHDLELHSKWHGQFFAPMSVCNAMGSMSIVDTEDKIKENEFIRVSEPACGSGAMVLGFANAMKEKKFNYNTQLVVTATDVDLKCVHMCYLQLSLYGIPAVIIHGNTLTVEEWSRWYTPVYMLNGWVWRSQCTLTTARNKDDEIIKRASEPMYDKIRKVVGYSGSKSVTEAPEIVPEKAQIEINEKKNVIDYKGMSVKKSKNKGKLKEESEQISLFDLAE